MTRNDRQGMKTAAGYADAVPQRVQPGAATTPAVPAVRPPGPPPVRQSVVPPGASVPAAPPPAGDTTRITEDGLPPVDAARQARQPTATPAPAHHTEISEMAAVTRGPIVEVDVSYEQGVSPTGEPLRVAIEVWTQNNVYAMDARMRCVAVRSQQTKSLVADHPFLGTRLVGGQIKSEGSVEMSYPLPRPGSFAVFEGRRGKKRRFSRTSVVERVVMRLRVVTVTGADATPTWETLVKD